MSKIVDALELALRLSAQTNDEFTAHDRALIEAALAEARAASTGEWVMVPLEAVRKVEAASTAPARAADILIDEALELFAAAPPAPTAFAESDGAISVWRRRCQETEAENAQLRNIAKEARRAIGDHHAPSDCYATGPLTGNAYFDLVQCPACSFIAMFDAAFNATEKEQHGAHSASIATGEGHG